MDGSPSSVFFVSAVSFFIIARQEILFVAEKSVNTACVFATTSFIYVTISCSYMTKGFSQRICRDGWGLMWP